jgi:hypothetical protein
VCQKIIGIAQKEGILTPEQQVVDDLSETSGSSGRAARSASRNR